MKAATVVMAGAFLLVGCRGAVSGTGTDSAPVMGSEAGTVRLLFAGDLMVGRGVARPLADEGVALFEEVRFDAGEGRLTDEEWRVMLAAGEAPERPEW
jgi:hypothetical protein